MLCLFHSLLYICRLPNRIRVLDFNDTFLSFEHVKSSFPQYTVKVGLPLLHHPVNMCIYWLTFSSAKLKISVNKFHHSSQQFMDYLYTVMCTVLFFCALLHISFMRCGCQSLFRLTFPESKLPQKRKLAGSESTDRDEEEGVTLLVEPYTIPNRGPYPYNQPKKYVYCMCTCNYVSLSP